MPISATDTAPLFSSPQRLPAGPGSRTSSTTRQGRRIHPPWRGWGRKLETISPIPPETWCRCSRWVGSHLTGARRHPRGQGCPTPSSEGRFSSGHEAGRPRASRPALSALPPLAPPPLGPALGRDSAAGVGDLPRDRRTGSAYPTRPPAPGRPIAGRRGAICRRGIGDWQGISPQPTNPPPNPSGTTDRRPTWAICRKIGTDPRPNPPPTAEPGTTDCRGPTWAICREIGATSPTRSERGSEGGAPTPDLGDSHP